MPLRIPRVVLRIGAGCARKGRLTEDPPGRTRHAAYMHDLIERDVFIMGGQYADRLGSMSIWEGMTAAEVREVMQRDPFVQDGVFVVEDVADWNVYVDTRIEPP